MNIYVIKIIFKVYYNVNKYGKCKSNWEKRMKNCMCYDSNFIKKIYLGSEIYKKHDKMI